VTGEFGFELRVCRWAERSWPPAGETSGTVLVARQLGSKRRRWDTVVVECDPEGLRARAGFGAAALDSDLLHVVRNAPVEWAWYRDALPEPDYPWRYVREAINRAAARDAVERRKRSNRVEIRRVRPYPDWVRRVIAVENKPDLDAAAARDLRSQLEYDVALGATDEVWVATRATDQRVEPVLLEDLPVEAGVLVIDDETPTEDSTGHPPTPSAGVAWHPRTLDPAATGTRILERPAGGEYDQSAARFEYVSPAEKRERRLVVAERAHERGWRDYVETMRPDCRHFQLQAAGTGLTPHCDAKCRGQTAAECSGSCPDFEPEPPAWRSRGPPIDGGPGALQRRVLARRRRRRRPGQEE
jgi:hypothetical protein